MAFSYNPFNLTWRDLPDIHQIKEFIAQIPGTKDSYTVYFTTNFSQNAINIISSRYFYGHKQSDNRENNFIDLISRVVDTIMLWGFAQHFFIEPNHQDVLYYTTKYNSTDLTNILNCVYLNSNGLNSLTESNKNGLLDLYRSFKANFYSDLTHNAREMPTLNEIMLYGLNLEYALIYQYGSFNSPVWFNLGNPYAKQQVSACFIDSVEDTIESIGEGCKTWFEIFRSGSGVGINRSTLRASCEPLSGSGYSSGPNTFAKVFDTIGAVTKSGGRSRRAAIMEILNVDHPDIEEFIWQKYLEEKKAQALIQAGYNADFTDPKGAYSSVWFQNSNQSVRVTDAFMQAVIDDATWYLVGVLGITPEEQTTNDNVKQFNNYIFVDKCHQGLLYKSIMEQNDLYLYKFDTGKLHKVYKTIKAKDLMHQIAKCAWASGDPGIQFHDTINKWRTVHARYGIINASNPCSEYMHVDNTSCNLASINLDKFHYKDSDGKHKIDFSMLYKVTQLFALAMNILIAPAYYPTKKIEFATRQHRPIGLGFTNLGTVLFKMKVAYDSDLARNIAATIMATIHFGAIDTSLYLGNLFSNSINKYTYYDKIIDFAFFSDNNDKISEIVYKHLDYWHNLLAKLYQYPSNSELLNMINTNDGLVSKISDIERILQSSNYNFVNTQFTVIAPTGTISFMMDATTTGIEPIFSFVTKKLLVGGGYLDIIYPFVEEVLDDLFKSDSTMISKIKDDILSKGYSDYIPDQYVPLFQTAVNLSEKFTIPHMAHVNMMAAIQPFVSGSISKTVNLNENVSVEDIEELYIKAWQLNLKSLAIYRNNSKSSQPMEIKTKKTDMSEIDLNSNDKVLNISQDNTVLKESTINVLRHKLPIEVSSTRIKFAVNGIEGYMHIGSDENNYPREIFLRVSKQGSTINGMLEVWAITLSLALQYNVPLDVIIDKFKGIKFEPAGLTNFTVPELRFASSIPDLIAKLLEYKYMSNSTNNSAIVKSLDAISNNNSHNINNKDIDGIDVKISNTHLDNKSEINRFWSDAVSIGNKISYSGSICAICGGMMIQTGTCETCVTCGSTGGCG